MFSTKVKSYTIVHVLLWCSLIIGPGDFNSEVRRTTTKRMKKRKKLQTFALFYIYVRSCIWQMIVSKATNSAFIFNMFILTKKSRWYFLMQNLLMCCWGVVGGCQGVAMKMLLSKLHRSSGQESPQNDLIIQNNICN